MRQNELYSIPPLRLEALKNSNTSRSTIEHSVVDFHGPSGNAQIVGPQPQSIAVSVLMGFLLFIAGMGAGAVVGTFIWHKVDDATDCGM